MIQGNSAVIADPSASHTSPRGYRRASVAEVLGDRPIALVGMMGAGKTVVGKRLAARLGLFFIDSDHEIEACAQSTITEIFARHGEAYFRDREAAVVSRLVSDGQRVIATGGGSFIHPSTRAVLKTSCLSIWLKADLDILMRRVRKRQNRPLLQTPDPEGTLRRLMEARYPIYAEADLTIVSRDGPHEQVVDDIVGAIEAFHPPLEATGRPR